MRKGLIPARAAAAALSVAMPAPVRAAGRTAEAIALLPGLGIGIAAARHAAANHDDDWNTDLCGEPFSPQEGVVCLPRPRKCYAHGNLSHRWTQRIFG